MKKLSLFIALLLAGASLFAQSPQMFKYQSVVRDASGTYIPNQLVSFRLSVIQDSPQGIIVYSESHTLPTNDFGLANLDVGNGSVLNGNFSSINWGEHEHFLRIELDANGGSNYQLMGTSQLLSVPYALHAASADNVDDADADPANELNQSMTLAGSTLNLTDAAGTLSANLAAINTDNQQLTLTGTTLSISNGNSILLPAGTGNTLNAAYNQGGAGAGRVITANAGEVQINAQGANAIGLRVNNAATGVAILAETASVANTFSAIQASTNSSSTIASAIIGNSNGAAWGVSGQIASTATAGAAVYGSNLRTTGGSGVLGIGFNGLVGETNYQTGFGVFGLNYDVNTPVGNAIGTYGRGYIGFWGEVNPGGAFAVYSNGDFAATGTKAFQIDHPEDPTNKYLRHFCIESNEVLNLYRGTVVFDINGEAEVLLPDYFELINRNFSYQLTPIGAAMNLFVKEEITNNRFVIAGGEPGKKVSWTVQAERNDPYLQQYPEKRENVVIKDGRNKGKYLMPNLYGQPTEKAEVQTPTSVKQEKMKLQSAE